MLLSRDNSRRRLQKYLSALLIFNPPFFYFEPATGTLPSLEHFAIPLIPSPHVSSPHALLQRSSGISNDKVCVREMKCKLGAASGCFQDAFGSKACAEFVHVSSSSLNTERDRCLETNRIRETESVRGAELLLAVSQSTVRCINYRMNG